MSLERDLVSAQGLVVKLLGLKEDTAVSVDSQLRRVRVRARARQ